MTANKMKIAEIKHWLYTMLVRIIKKIKTDHIISWPSD